MTDKHKVHESLKDLLVPLTDLQPLENNPRIGNVEAIISSYDEFGQVKPIVIRLNEDEQATVIAGNHQVEAAKRLGWTHIAAVPFDGDDKRAVAFALADNRTRRGRRRPLPRAPAHTSDPGRGSHRDRQQRTLSRRRRPRPGSPGGG